MVKDMIGLNAFNKVGMPKLKGHIKMTLHNCRTGKNEVVEGENIVTNAVADILGANIAGGVEFGSLTPLWSKWFGGVLCYQQAHALNNGVLDPNDYFIKSDSTQHLTAHAGQTAVDSEHDDDLTRGNPVGVAYIQTNNSIKQVFEWGSARGNGTISALSLTHSDTGSYGTGGNFYDFINLFCPYDIISRTDDNWKWVDLSTVLNKAVPVAQYDEANSLNFFLGEDDFTFSTTSDKVTVYINKLAYSKVGLYQTMYPSATLNRVFTVQTPITFYNMPCFYFDYENKYLWLFTNSTGRNTFDNTNVRYCVIDCENEEMVNLGTEQDPVYYKTIVSDTSNIAHLTRWNDEYFCNANVFKFGDDVYLPTLTSNDYQITGFKRISLTTAVQTSLTMPATVEDLPAIIGSEEMQILLHRPHTTNNSFVFNGNNIWKCKNNLATLGDIVFQYYASSPYNVSSLVTPANWYRSSKPSSQRYILANKLINATKFNLTSPVTKTSSQSMTVEYTLTEVSENE